MGSFASQLNPSPSPKHGGEVIMANSKLAKLPSSLFSLSFYLKKLDLSRNRLSVLPSVFANLAVLEDLNLSVNNFSHFPIDILALSKLRELDLSFNNIQEIPGGIPALKNLTHLSMKTNKLYQLPVELGYLEKLAVLRLENNFIDSIPESFSKLTLLKVLNLAFNQLETLPNSLIDWSKYCNIEELILFGNMISEPPVFIASLSSLTVLSLARNNIKALPEEFYRLENLTRFILAANSLTYPLTTSLDLPSLTELDLRGNCIDQLPDISQLQCLKILDISFNPVKYLFVEQIQQLTSMQMIKVHTRQIDSLKAQDTSKTIETPEYEDIIKEVDIDSTTEESLFNHAYKIQNIHFDLDVEYLVSALPRVDKIIPSLYLSSTHGANNYPLLMQLGITHILTVAEELQPRFPHSFYYHAISVGDSPIMDNILQFFPVCTRFIDQGRKFGGILVHCASGVSRSVTAVCAYLMEYEKYNLEKALSVIRVARPIAKPNPGTLSFCGENNRTGFMEQLTSWEKELTKRKNASN